MRIRRVIRGVTAGFQEQIYRGRAPPRIREGSRRPIPSTYRVRAGAHPQSHYAVRHLIAQQRRKRFGAAGTRQTVGPRNQPRNRSAGVPLHVQGHIMAMTTGITESEVKLMEFLLCCHPSSVKYSRLAK